MTKQAATRAARRLAKSLGPTWKTRVWENTGWCWSVVSDDGKLKIHEHAGTYTAFLGDGAVGGRWAESRTTPKRAIRAVYDRARDEVAEAEALCAAAETALKRLP